MEKDKDIIETITKFHNNIKYTTHYVNRPIRQGDPQGGSIGSCINGTYTTTEIITYVYKDTL